MKRNILKNKQVEIQQYDYGAIILISSVVISKHLSGHFHDKN